MIGQQDIAQIRDILRQQLPLLAEHYGVTSLGLFGSYVRGEARPGSDLDILQAISKLRLLPLHWRHEQTCANRRTVGGD